MCWPQTPPGHQAKVDCLNNAAFAQALKQSSGSENIGEMKQNTSTHSQYYLEQVLVTMESM